MTFCPRSRKTLRSIRSRLTKTVPAIKRLSRIFRVAMRRTRGRPPILCKRATRYP